MLTYCAAVLTSFDLLSLKLAQRLHLHWKTSTPILIFRVKKPTENAQTDGWTGKTGGLLGRQHKQNSLALQNKQKVAVKPDIIS